MTGFAVAMALLAAIGAWFVWAGTRKPVRGRISQRVAEVGRRAVPVVSEVDLGDGLPYAALLLAPIRRIFLLAEVSLRPVHSAVAAATVAALIAIAFAVSPYVAAIAFAVLTSAATLYFRGRAERNRQKFLESLPAFIERLQQLIGAGNSLANAFERALEYSTPLTRSYLRPVAFRLAHGATLAESLYLQGQRLGVGELTMLSLIFHANLRFGGSLSDALSRVVVALNNRVQVQREFNAMTAEMRSSAKVLSALPVVVAGLVFSVNPHYLTFFIEDAFGRTVLGGAVAWALIGVAILRQMSRIEG